jgi:hypothetical protein
MKTARTISTSVNASQRCTGEVTPCAINHKIVACVDVTILVSRTSARDSCHRAVTTATPGNSVSLWLTLSDSLTAVGTTSLRRLFCCPRERPGTRSR